MPHLTDGTNLASDLNALTCGAEQRLLQKLGSKKAVEDRVNYILSRLRADFDKTDADLVVLVVNTLVMGLVRSIPGRTVV
jgi:hypothetical protein